MIISHQKKSGYNSLVPISGGSATAFSAFKVSAKNGLFLGKWQMASGRRAGRHLSGA
ncbi:hypothetical protein C427_4444 [Paraglaciecola psychrophila 170]|uniref:Uncharacterized protein n=1 Tax=Paraglaciecola psychrophila 170 TaxID=1129794 RepID=K7AEQ1_9ALTE|nr:hypothetical protein C427_4444 [Paraglaciecola psychrophila 170]GAC39123.1 hypothetical protein GPSY_3512 [Paraglaciecola psychrophila 170]